MIALIVVALLTIFGLVIMMFLIRHLTRNQTYVTDPSGRSLSPVESSGGPVKSGSDTDGISVKAPGGGKSPPKAAGHLDGVGKTSSGGSLGKPSEPEPPPREPRYVKKGKKVGPHHLTTDDDDEHVEGVPPKLKLPKTTASLRGMPSIEKINEKEKKSKELAKMSAKKGKDGSVESTGSAGKEKKPIVPGNHDWKEMKKQMATSTTSSPTSASPDSPGVHAVNDGHREPSDDRLFDRDREKSISSSDSFGSSGKLVKKRESDGAVRKTSSGGVKKFGSGLKGLFGKKASKESPTTAYTTNTKSDSGGSLDLKNAASKDVKGNIQSKSHTK